MWFLTSTLVLWGATATMGRWDYDVLAPVVQWTWWTFNLYACGAAAMREAFTSLLTKVAGVVGYSLLVIYYTTMSETYAGFLPTSTDNPELWPQLFLAVNLVGPMLLVTVGCLSAAVQTRGEE